MKFDTNSSILEKKCLNKVLYVAMHYDYGKQEQGTSFEFHNFYLTLKRMFPEVIEFDFATVLQQVGKDRMNELLLETAARVGPDLVFCVLFTDELTPSTISKLSETYTTFNWFCDDHWRFNSFSRHYAPYFTFVSTTDAHALAKYEAIGYRTTLLTQWACNHFSYRKQPDVVRTIDVSFVGQPHGNRRSWIEYLRKSCVEVQAYGQGWPNGRIAQDQMIRIFNASQINLNLSNSSMNIHTLLRRQEQIKGRNFEIPGCGGFLLTNYVSHLEEFYEFGKEIVCFENKRDLLQKVRYYLSHEDEREEIARRGFERTCHEHTYEKRFQTLFKSMGFEL